MTEITPKDLYKVAEILVEDSGLEPESRFKEFEVKLKLDDIITLFLASIDESLEYEYPSLILGNKQLDNKYMTERARSDDRLERICSILEKAGLEREVFLNQLWISKNEMLDKVNEINDILREVEIDSKNV